MYLVCIAARARAFPREKTTRCDRLSDPFVCNAIPTSELINAVAYTSKGLEIKNKKKIEGKKSRRKMYT
jgi:hypothetical protein